MARKRVDLLQGTPDLLALEAPALGPPRGLGVPRRVERMTTGTLRVKPGPPDPAPRRMEEAGRGASGDDRKANDYGLTKAGPRQLTAGTKDWQRIALATAAALETPKGDAAMSALRQLVSLWPSLVGAELGEAARRRGAGIPGCAGRREGRPNEV